jgi:hypothetical protein
MPIPNNPELYTGEFLTENVGTIDAHASLVDGRPTGLGRDPGAAAKVAAGW